MLRFLLFPWGQICILGWHFLGHIVSGAIADGRVLGREYRIWALFWEVIIRREELLYVAHKSWRNRGAVSG